MKNNNLQSRSGVEHAKKWKMLEETSRQKQTVTNVYGAETMPGGSMQQSQASESEKLFIIGCHKNNGSRPPIILIIGGSFKSIRFVWIKGCER